MSVVRIDSLENTADVKNFDFSFFTLPQVLTKVFTKSDWWGYFKGNELICIWPVPLNSHSECLSSLPFTYYVGPVWKIPLPNLPAHRALKITKDVYNAFLNKFREQYQLFAAELKPTLIDARPFIWMSKTGEQILTELNYTAILHVDCLDNMSKNFRQVKRWELKHIPESRFRTSTNDHNPLEVINFYRSQPFAFRAEKEDEHLYAVMERYLNLSYEEGVHSITIRDATNKKMVGFSLLGIYKQTLNVLISITEREFASQFFLSTYLHKLIFELAYRLDVEWIDFNGANGPLLADAKHSFGAVPKLYFKISY